ncbi:hypothetical protein CC78DRAFT_533349 [Lojkania enalia]|uniref:MARVEL domain-containing protein n=1 Tax=Lojkania enalia TaxID=147567 RepID=A0A9P4KAL4_9PLEO|nr:hypothetical protein CC78DRAFT_533349 [Didymosphaeria enalia]
MIFAPVWTVLSLVPLILLPLKWPYMATGSPGKFLLLALECVTMLYWFSGFIALAVFLSDRICFGTVCSVAKAGTAISAFQWVAFAATVVGGVMSLFKKHGGVAREPKVEMHQGV